MSEEGRVLDLWYLPEPTGYQQARNLVICLPKLPSSPHHLLLNYPCYKRWQKYTDAMTTGGGSPGSSGFRFWPFPSSLAFGNLILATHPQRPGSAPPTSALPSTQVHAAVKSSTLITQIFGDPDRGFALSGNSRHRAPERKSAVIASNRLRKRAIWFT
jgi:hypothetical protein